MGDVRFAQPYHRLKDSGDPRSVLRSMDDEDVVAALAVAARSDDDYLANVLATEVQNRLRRMNTSLNTMAEGVCYVDEAGHVTYMNPAAERMLGWTIEELSGRPSHETIHHLRADGSPYPVQACPIFRVTQLGGTADVDDEVFVRRDGSTFPVHYVACGVDRDGVVVGAVYVFRDLTERRRHEAALHEARERLRAVVETAPIILFALDPDGVFTLAEGKGLELYGIAQGESVGRTVYEYSNEPDAVREYVRRALAGETFSTVDASRGRTLETHWRPLRDERGRVVGVSGVSVDITRRVRHERALRESEERFRLVSRATNDVIWDMDVETGDIWWNDNFYTAFGYSPRDVRGHIEDWRSRLHPEDAERVGRELDEALASGQEVWSWEYRFRRGDGSYAHVRDRGFIARDEGGRAVRMVGTLQDVTPERRAEEELRRDSEVYRALYENSATMYYALDTDGTILLLNQRGAARLGYSQDELLGRPVFDLFHPEEREAAREAFRRFAARGAGAFTEWRFRKVRSDGAELRVRELAQLLPWGGGGVVVLLNCVELPPP